MVGDEALLVGRSAPLGVITTRIESSLSGRGSVLLVEGAAGNGKTRLLDDALARAPAGVEVIRGRADELEQHRPFGPLRVSLGLARQAHDPRRRDVAELLTGAAPAGQGPVQLGHVGDARFRAVDAVVDLVQELASEPTVLAIDDLHWADEATLLTLRQLGRRARFLPLTLALSFRSPSSGSPLAQLTAGLVTDGAERITVEELSPDDVAELVQATLGAPAGRSLQPALDEAAGSPLFVTELLRSLVAEQRVTVVDGQAELIDGDLPVSFVDTVTRQVDALPHDTAAVLRAAAVAGSDFTVGEVVALVDSSEPKVVTLLAAALRDGLVVEAGDRLAFRHALARRAIYQGIPAQLQQSQHRALADALTQTGAPTERIAWHLAASTQPPDAEVAEWLRAAAATEAVSAPAVAADLLTRALEFLPPEEPTRNAVAADLARELVWAGRTEQGASLAEETLLTGRNTQLRAVLALARLLQGRYVEAVAAIELAASDDTLDAATRAQLRAEAGLARFLSGDMSGAERDGVAALEEGRRHGDELATCVGLCTLSWTANASGDHAAAVRFADEAVQRAEAAPGPALARYSPHLFLGLVLVGQNRLEEAERVLRTGRGIAESAGTLQNIPAYYACLALVLLYAGEWDDMLAECEAGLVAADELDVTVGVVWLHALRAYVSVHRDDLVTAQAAIDAGESAMLASGAQIGADWLMLARGMLNETADPGSALAILGNAWDLYEALGIRSHREAIAPELARLAVEAGDLARAGAVRDRLATSGDESPYVAHVAGLVKQDAGLLLDAVEEARKYARPLACARTIEDAAVALASQGRSEDAGRAFDEAAELYETLGATRDIARLNAKRRAAGITRGKRGPRNRPSRGWDSLTDTEANVVRLTAEGLTNRQIGERLFISRRTVETHISHVFTKLDLGSRVELTRAFATR